METVTLARAQMGLSLAFHIVFAAFGVGLPLLLVIAEALAARTNDGRYRLLAERMAKGTAILFAVGAVSGTVLSFEMGLLWPGLMSRFGDVIGHLREVAVQRVEAVGGFDPDIAATAAISARLTCLDILATRNDSRVRSRVSDERMCSVTIYRVCDTLRSRRR